MESGRNEEIPGQRLLIIKPYYEEKNELQLNTNVMKSINAYVQHLVHGLIF